MKDEKGNYQEVTSFKADNELSFIGPSQFLGFRSLVSVIIPSSVQYIDDSAFEGCRQLTSVTLPESLKGIEEDAFFNCTFLKHVFYCGHKDEWEKIKIGEGNDCLSSSDLYFFTSNGINEKSSGKWWYYDKEGETVLKVIEEN